MGITSYILQPFAGLIESRNYLKATLAANPPTHILVKQAAMQVLFAGGVCLGAIAMNCVAMTAIYYNVPMVAIFLGNSLICLKEPSLAPAALSFSSGMLAVISLVTCVALRTLFPVVGIIFGSLVHLGSGAMYCKDFQEQFTNNYLPLANDLSYAPMLNNIIAWTP